jgi:hypothetical protein
MVQKGEREARQAKKEMVESTPFPRLRWEREVRLWRTADVVPASCRRVI